MLIFAGIVPSWSFVHSDAMPFELSLVVPPQEERKKHTREGDVKTPLFLFSHTQRKEVVCFHSSTIVKSFPGESFT
jgi:hypothetical protein